MPPTDSEMSVFAPCLARSLPGMSIDELIFISVCVYMYIGGEKKKFFFFLFFFKERKGLNV